jgi:hypothetical protein
LRTPQACADQGLRRVREEVDHQDLNVSAEDVGYCDIEVERPKVEAGR